MDHARGSRVDTQQTDSKYTDLTTTASFKCYVQANSGVPAAAVLSDFFTAALREARSERPASLASRIPALDELTEGGFPVNALTELFIPHAGIGEVRMLLPALASLKHVTWVLPCDSEAAPYAPALADAGLDLDRQLFSIPSTPEEAFW